MPLLSKWHSKVHLDSNPQTLACASSPGVVWPLGSRHLACALPMPHLSAVLLITARSHIKRRLPRGLPRPPPAPWPCSAPAWAMSSCVELPDQHSLSVKTGSRRRAAPLPDRGSWWPHMSVVFAPHPQHTRGTADCVCTSWLLRK